MGLKRLVDTFHFIHGCLMPPSQGLACPVIRDRLTCPQAFVKRAPTGNRLLFPVLARATQAVQSTRFTHERSTSNIHRLVHSSISFFEKVSDSLKLGFYIRNTILVIRIFFCYIEGKGVGLRPFICTCTIVFPSLPLPSFCTHLGLVFSPSRLRTCMYRNSTHVSSGLC